MDFLVRPLRRVRHDLMSLLMTCIFQLVFSNEVLSGQTLELDLTQALSQVKQNDLALERFKLDAQAFEAAADAQSFWPDPVLFTSAQNLPTDTFNFDQEAMTQFRFGLRQKIPVGDTLSIKHDIGQLKSARQLINRDARWLTLKRATEQAWLEAWYWQKTLEILEDDLVFLKQILDITQSLYRVGNREQSDVISAELELIQLDEQRIGAQQKYDRYRDNLNTLAKRNLQPRALSSVLADLRQGLLDEGDDLDRLQLHPEILTQQQAVDIAQQDIVLAEQSYKPSWGFELSYGLRDGTNANGSDRPDFLTAGVNVQLPLFGSNSQDNLLSAAKQRSASEKNKKLDRLSSMRYQYKNVRQQFLTSVQQSELYEAQILPALSQQKQSTLNAYQSDRAGFTSVVMVYLKEQKFRLKYQRLLVDQQKMLSKLNYWVPPVFDENEGKAKDAAARKNTYERKTL